MVGERFGFVKTSLILVLAFLLYSCGSGGGGSLNPNPADNPSYLQLKIDNAYQTVEPNGKTVIPIQVYVYNKNGHLLDRGTAQVSLSPNIGSLDADSKEVTNGVLTFYYTVPDYDTVAAAGADQVQISVTVTNYDSGVSASANKIIYFKTYPSKIVALIPDNSTILPADGTTTVPITVYAYRGDGRPLAGATVYAYANPNIGSLDSNSQVTDDSGIAKFNYRLPSKQDLLLAKSNMVTLKFTDESGNVTSTAVIHFSNVSVGNGVPAALILEAEPSVLFTSNVSNGPKISQIIAKVVDSSGSPVSGYKVRFSLERNPNGSYLTNSEVNIQNGYAITDFVSGSESGTALISAEVEGRPDVNGTVSLTLEGGIPNSITLLESGNVKANDDNGTREIYIYALVKGSDGSNVADGTLVHFNVTDSCGGMISSDSKTISGVAAARLIYPASCIWKRFTISAISDNGVSSSMSDYYPAVDPVNLTLSGPTDISSSGGDVYVYLRLKDEGGKGLPVSGAQVRMYSTLDNVTFNPLLVVTDQSGQGYTIVHIPENPVIVNPDNTTTSEERDIVITGQVGTTIGSITITQEAPQTQ